MVVESILRGGISIREEQFGFITETGFMDAVFAIYLDQGKRYGVV